MKCEAIVRHWSDPQHALIIRGFHSIRDAKQMAPQLVRGGQSLRLDDLSGFTRWKFDGKKWQRPEPGTA